MQLDVIHLTINTRLGLFWVSLLKVRTYMGNYSYNLWDIPHGVLSLSLFCRRFQFVAKYRERISRGLSRFYLIAAYILNNY